MNSRRTFLLTSGAAGLAAGLPGLAAAAPDTDKRLLLVILRGGLDGLSAFPPYGDPAYRDARGGLVLPAPGSRDGTIRLDRTFAMHPTLKPLEPLYHKGEMLVAHAVAIPARTRSHFVAQDVLEAGSATTRIGDDGWLNRALGLMPQRDTRAGLVLGYDVPRVMRGAMAVASWAPARLPGAAPGLVDSLTRLYGGDPLLGPALTEGLRAQAMTGSVLGRGSGMTRGNLRNRNQFATLAGAAGRLLAAPDGARVAVVEMGGWDTHTNQEARLDRNLALLGKGLAALPELLGPAWRHTAVVVVTEFGRTVRGNGTRGSDHGTGSVAFLLGGAVAGGRVAADWPGLAPDRLLEARDLKPTSDMRGLFKSVLRDHLGVSQAKLDRVVFPDSAGAAPPPGKIIV